MRKILLINFLFLAVILIITSCINIPLTFIYRELEAFTCQTPEEREAAIFAEKERIRTLKLQLAKRNRGIVAIQRQLDNIPDRTELAQYQRRFHELYNESK